MTREQDKTVEALALLYGGAAKVLTVVAPVTGAILVRTETGGLFLVFRDGGVIRNKGEIRRKISAEEIQVAAYGADVWVATPEEVERERYNAEGDPEEERVRGAARALRFLGQRLSDAEILALFAERKDR